MSPRSWAFLAMGCATAPTTSPTSPVSSSPVPSSPPVDADADGAVAEQDCDDHDPARRPGAPELCNGVDDDCDGVADDDPVDAVDGWADADGDGWGDPASPARRCPSEALFATQAADCDDRDVFVRPGARELCDGTDDDCDPATPDVCFACVWLADNLRTLRFDPAGVSLDDRTGCGFVDVDREGHPLVAIDAALLVIDPETCDTVDRYDVEERYGNPFDDTASTVTPGDYGLRPRAVAWGPADELYIAWQDEAYWTCGVDRYLPDGTFDANVYTSDGPCLYIESVAVGPDGALYFATGSSVERVDPTTGLAQPIVVPGDGGLYAPWQVAFRDHRLWVLDMADSSVVRFDASTFALVDRFVSAPAPEPPMHGGDFAFLPDGDLLISSAQQDAILRYDGAAGAPEGVFGSGIPGYFAADLSLGPCPP